MDIALEILFVLVLRRYSSCYCIATPSSGYSEFYFQVFHLCRIHRQTKIFDQVYHLYLKGYTYEKKEKYPVIAFLDMYIARLKIV